MKTVWDRISNGSIDASYASVVSSALMVCKFLLVCFMCPFKFYMDVGGMLHQLHRHVGPLGKVTFLDGLYKGLVKRAKQVTW